MPEALPQFHRTNRLPPNPADAPSVSPSVLRDLKRIDPALELRFSHYMVSGMDGTPIIFKQTNEPIHKPRWHVWIKDGRGLYYRVMVLEADGEYVAPDQRLIQQLESDEARIYGAKEAARREQERQEAEREKRKEEDLKKEQDFISANRKQLAEALSDPGKPIDFKSGGGNITSFRGQSSRTRTEERPVSPFEEWENPWRHG